MTMLPLMTQCLANLIKIVHQTLIAPQNADYNRQIRFHQG
jgi:hypothetical protein